MAPAPRRPVPASALGLVAGKALAEAPTKPAENEGEEARSILLCRHGMLHGADTDGLLRFPLDPEAPPRWTR